MINDDGKLFLFREENGGDLFYSQPSGSSWTTPVEFDARISNNHLASHFFINEHEDRIIFASDEDTDGLDIYESFRDPANGKWSKPAPSLPVSTQITMKTVLTCLPTKKPYTLAPTGLVE